MSATTPPRPDLGPRANDVARRRRRELALLAGAVVLLAAAIGVAASPGGVAPSGFPSPFPSPFTSTGSVVVVPPPATRCPDVAPLHDVRLPQGWMYHVDRDGGYVVAVPSSAPAEAATTGSHRYLFRPGGTANTIDWYDDYAVPEDQTTVFLRGQAHTTIGKLPTKPRMIRFRSITDPELPGLEVRYLSGSGRYVGILRFYLVNGRFYQVGITVGVDGEGELRDQIRAFFESFTPFPGCPMPRLPSPTPTPEALRSEGVLEAP